MGCKYTLTSQYRSWLEPASLKGWGRGRVIHSKKKLPKSAAVTVGSGH